MPEEKMHFKDYRSGMLTNGIERAAHRALLYSTGLDREDLGKPMIAVVNSFTCGSWRTSLSRGSSRRGASPGSSAPSPSATASARGTKG